MATNIVQMKDGSGNNQYPVTSAEAVGMPDGSGNLQTYLNKRVTELNISVLYPTNGEGGTNKYTLAGAIAQVPAEYRTFVGLKITFINNDTSKSESWKYNGGTFTTTSNWVQGDGSGGNLILEWNTDVATTRKQVLSQERKSLLQISYKNGDGDIINEQYIGNYLIDSEWIKDENWVKIPNEKEFDTVSLSFNLSGVNKIITFKEEDIQNWEHGLINRTNGTFVSNESFRTSTFFELENASLFIAKLYNIDNWSSQAAIAEYDENKKFIGYVDADENLILGKGGKSTVNNFLYYCFSNKCKFYRVGLPISTDGSIKNTIEILGLNSGLQDINFNPLNNNLLLDRVFNAIQSDGTEATSDLKKYSSTNFIPIEVGDIIYSNTTPILQAALAFYDEDKKFIEAINDKLATGDRLYEYKVTDNRYKFVRGSFNTTERGGVFFIKKASTSKNRSIATSLADFEHKTKFNSYLFKNEGFIIDETLFSFSNKSAGVEIEGNSVKVESSIGYGSFQIKSTIPLIYPNCAAFVVMRIKLLSLDGDDTTQAIITDTFNSARQTFFNVGDEKLVLIKAQNDIDSDLYPPCNISSIIIYNNSSWEIKDLYTININTDIFPIMQEFCIRDYDANSLSNTMIPQTNTNSIFERIENFADKLDRGMNVSELSVYSRYASSFWTSTYYFRKTYASFGDSITEFSQSTVVLQGNKKQSYRENNYPEHIAAYYNFKLLNLGKSGARPINNLTDENLAKLPEDTVLVTISGGQNGWTTADVDSLDRGTDVGAINYAIDYIRGKFPKCQIVLVPTYIDNGDHISFSDYKKISENKNVPLADTYNLKLIDWERDKSEQILRYDNVHLTGYGASRMAAVVRETIRPLIF